MGRGFTATNARISYRNHGTINNDPNKNNKTNFQIIIEHYYLGFSLIELLVSLLLSNIIIIGVLQGYFFIQRVILKFEERLTLNQKVDIVDFYLRQDIQFSGYRGCRSCDESLLDINHVKKLNRLILKEQRLITKKIFPGCQAKELPKKIVDKINKQEIKANTNILFIKDIPKAIYKLTSPMLDPCATITTKDAFDLHDGVFLAIADAKSIERFIASKVIGSRYIDLQLLENNNICLNRGYDVNAEVIALQWVVYYLAKQSLLAETYTLYRDDVTNNAEALIDGVEDFYVNLIYQNKEQVNAVGAEIGVLLRNEVKLFGKQTLIWRNSNHDFIDGYFRKSVIFTVARRNVC